MIVGRPCALRHAPRSGRRQTAKGDRGAAMVEFALVLPVLLITILGAFSGGTAYSQRLSLSGAAREASRFAATLPVASATGGTLNGWLGDVATAAEQAATGDLKT